MKIAYHFTVPPEKGEYGSDIYKKIFFEILSLRHHPIKSKILTGDLLLWGKINENNKARILTELLQLGNNTWKKFKTENIQKLITETVFIICFESITKDTAEKLDNQLLKYSSYIGSFEIDDSNEIQWIFYGEYIHPQLRLENKTLSILSENAESVDHGFKEIFIGLGFDEIKDEFTSFRYTIFDDNYNYEVARRLAEWKKQANNLLGTVIDSIISNLIDTAPNLGEKLWATLDTFHKSETPEQLAQVMASCRRTFEYVIDCIFPASKEIIDGHKLNKECYKNRLYQFASESAKSDTNIGLITANTDLLFEQWGKLNLLANKGVHSDIFQHETRRCVIRTIILLDDIISLRTEPFEIKTTTEKALRKLVKNLKKNASC